MGRISDDELIRLYRNAYCFVFFLHFMRDLAFPSGSTQACGCPVIASNAAAIPEVLGDSAIYVDPLNNVALTAAMENIVVNTELRQFLVTAGNENMRRFSWLFSAKKLSQIIDNVNF